MGWEPTRLVGVAATVAGTELAVAFGSRAEWWAGVGLAAALGALLAVRGARAGTGPGPLRATLVGYALGTVVALAVTTATLASVLVLPPMYAAWQAGVTTWAAWALVGVTLVGTYFLASVVAVAR
jgi:hypothetical protein